MLTNRQKTCLSKARTYRKTKFMSWEYGREYLSFVEDGHVSPQRFKSLAGASDKVTPIRKSKPKASMELHKYLDICKRRYLCNGIGSKSQSGVNTPDEIRDEWRLLKK